MPRLPRKNDANSILARQQALGLPEVDVEPYAKAAESVTGLVSIPVSVAQLAVSLGEYELSEDGEVLETGRSDEEVVVPLAHTEGGLTASRAARREGDRGVRRLPNVRDRGPNYPSILLRLQATRETRSRSRAGSRSRCRRCASSSASRTARSCPVIAVLREAKTHVVGPMCHVLWRFTTGDAFGANMMTRNAYALNMAFVLPQAPVPIERVRSSRRTWAATRSRRSSTSSRATARR